MKTRNQRTVTVLARYQIKRDGYFNGKLYKAGWVVLSVENDQGARYEVILRRNGIHSCSCPATRRCYHIDRAIEIDNAHQPARIARHKVRRDAAKLAQSLTTQAAPAVTPDLATRGALNGARAYSLLR